MTKTAEPITRIAFYGPGEGKRFACVEISSQTHDAFKRAARREGKDLGEWVDARLYGILSEMEQALTR